MHTCVETCGRNSAPPGGVPIRGSMRLQHPGAWTRHARGRWCCCRCCFAVAEERPRPVVLAEPEDPEVQLTLDPNSWVHKWDNTQLGGEVCQFKMWVAGPPGPVKLIVR